MVSSVVPEGISPAIPSSIEVLAFSPDGLAGDRLPGRRVNRLWSVDSGVWTGSRLVPQGAGDPSAVQPRRPAPCSPPAATARPASSTFLEPPTKANRQPSSRSWRQMREYWSPWKDRKQPPRSPPPSLLHRSLSVNGALHRSQRRGPFRVCRHHEWLAVRTNSWSSKHRLPEYASPLYWMWHNTWLPSSRCRW